MCKPVSLLACLALSSHCSPIDAIHQLLRSSSLTQWRRLPTAIGTAGNSPRRPPQPRHRGQSRVKDAPHPSRTFARFLLVFKPSASFSPSSSSCVRVAQKRRCIGQCQPRHPGRFVPACRMTDESTPQEEYTTGLSRFLPSDAINQGTLLRILLPTIIASVLSYLVFDDVSLYIRLFLNDNVIAILKEDSANQIEDSVKVFQALFGFLGGTAFSVLYDQQVAIYLALFDEVSVAKSLLEQTTFVCWGRPFYQSALMEIRNYVENDLCGFHKAPAQMVAMRAGQDPLESLMYLTSVGVPGVVYDTIRSLRACRGARLGALQRKLPTIYIVLLYLLAFGDLIPFITLGAGETTDAVLGWECYIFAFVVGMHMLLLRTIDELWQNSGSIFNVDLTLKEMVSGLLEELDDRQQQAPVLNSSLPSVTAGRMDDYGGMVPDWDFNDIVTV